MNHHKLCEECKKALARVPDNCKRYCVPCYKKQPLFTPIGGRNGVHRT